MEFQQGLSAVISKISQVKGFGENLNRKWISVTLATLVCLFKFTKVSINVINKRRVRNLAKAQNFKICVIGAGVSGIEAAIKLKEAGIEYEVYEQSEEAGGTWFDNKYPGCACDVAAYAYCYSFNLNPNWTATWVPRNELFSYFVGTAKKFGVHDGIHFKHRVVSALFYEKTCKWIVKITDLNSGKTFEKEYSAVIAATGQLNRPKIPEIPGRSNFKGKQMHTALWDEDFSFKGKRVIGIGTGASAIQVFPELAKICSNLTIVQRSPTYCMNRDSWTYSSLSKVFLNWVPGLLRFRYYLALGFNEIFFWTALRKKPGHFKTPQEEFTDSQKYWRKLFVDKIKNDLTPDLDTFSDLNQALIPGDKMKEEYLKYNASQRSHLIKVSTPDFVPGCKRVAISNSWLPMLIRKNVTLETDKLVSVETDGVVLERQDGSVVKVVGDVIIWATGFDTTTFEANIEFSVVKETGSTVSLKEQWKDGASAYMGVTVDNFPNLFLLYGPNTNLGHNSIIFMIECEMEHNLELIKKLILSRAKALVVKKDKFQLYNQMLQRELAGLSFSSDNCGSWYKSESGFQSLNWSRDIRAFNKMMKTVSLWDYNLLG